MDEWAANLTLAMKSNDEVDPAMIGRNEDNSGEFEGSLEAARYDKGLLKPTELADHVMSKVDVINKNGQVRGAWCTLGEVMRGRSQRASWNQG